MRLSLAAVALLLVASACSGDDSPDRPDDTAPPDVATSSALTGTRERARCIVSDPEGELIVVPGTLDPDQPLRLGDAELIDAVNLEVVESSVVAFSGRAGLQGIVQDYPPLPNAGLADSLADWSERRPLAGHQVAADAPQQAVLVALRLVDATRPGHLDGVRLTYADDAAPTEMVQPVLVEPHDALCTIAEVDGTLAWVPAS
ncbi:hypothetical protein GCM10023340_34010 [Nocardioides marinquilinus]|uniref:Lipoprotein n=1 Tax=Nocardioides marinquilinus TaxID=1210400 RepID=A0ABP9PWV7_9ACTN